MTARSPSFGLIAEGPTDFALIQHLLAGYLGDPDVDLRALQPKPESDDPGGWVEVLRYLSSEDFPAAFEFVDFVIVQIDTDVCEEAGYDVCRRDAEGRERADAELWRAVCERLICEIPDDVYQAQQEKLIFAIAIESSECWLLPAVFPNHPRKAAKTKNCLATLNRELSARHGFSIDPAAKQVKYYRKALRTLDRKRKLHTMGNKNPSLGVFVRELDRRLNALSTQNVPVE